MYTPCFIGITRPGLESPIYRFVFFLKVLPMSPNICNPCYWLIHLVIVKGWEGVVNNYALPIQYYVL